MKVWWKVIQMQKSSLTLEVVRLMSVLQPILQPG